MFHSFADATRTARNIQPCDVEDKLHNKPVIGFDVLAAAPKRPARKVQVGTAQVGIAQVGTFAISAARFQPFRVPLKNLYFAVGKLSHGKSSTPAAT